MQHKYSVARFAIRFLNQFFLKWNFDSVSLYSISNAALREVDWAQIWPRVWRKPHIQTLTVLNFLTFQFLWHFYWCLNVPLYPKLSNALWNLVYIIVSSTACSRNRRLI